MAVIWAANVALVRTPSGFSQLGLYNAANQVRAAVTYIPAVLVQAALPALADLHEARDRHNYGRVLRSNLMAVAAGAGGIALLAGIGAAWIMRAFGPVFRSEWLFIPALAWPAVLSSLASVVGQAIASAGRMWWGVVVNSVRSATLLGVVQWAVPKYASLGLVFATLAAYAVHAATSFWFAFRGLEPLP